MIVKPLCEYDVSILRYIEGTLVMLNEMFGVNYISRDRDGELAVHSTYPKLSRYTGMYARDNEVNHSEQAGLLDGIERSFDFKFPIEWEESEPGRGVLKVERLIYDIRKAIEKKWCSNELVYLRLRGLEYKKLRVLYTIASEYERMGYKYVAWQYRKEGKTSFWKYKPCKYEDCWSSDDEFSWIIDFIPGLLECKDWPVRWEDDNPVLISEILQAIAKLNTERNGTIFGNGIRQQAVDKAFTLESDIQAAIDKYRRELEVANNG